MDMHTNTLDETTQKEHGVRTVMADTIKREKELSASVTEAALWLKFWSALE